MSSDVSSEEVSQQLEAGSEQLIGGLIPVTDLLPAYQDNPGSFVAGIHFLAKKFRSMRRVRGDGNCFYRSLLFSYLEELLCRLQSTNDEVRQAGLREHQRLTSVIESSKEQLIKVGYDEFVFDMFYEEFVDLLNSLLPCHEKDESLTFASLLEKFTGEQADCYTWYMRLITAGYLIEHYERYLPFIMTDDSVSASSIADQKVSQLLNGSDGDAAMRGYCQREVEPMGKESEELHANALTEVLGLSVNIAYLDGRPFKESDGVGCISLNSSSAGESSVTVHLLYRPGHYDILYLDRDPE